MSETKNYFAELAVIDVSKHVEKKGRFSYLSWSWAVDRLLKNILMPHGKLLGLMDYLI